VAEIVKIGTSNG